MASTETLKSIENFLSSFDDAVMFFDFDGKLQWFNDVANKRLSIVIKRSLENGMELKNYMPKYLGDIFYDDFKKCISGKNVSFERIVNHTEEEKFYVQVTMSPVYDETKNLIGVISVSKDITKQKFIEKELLNSNERYELATKATNDIIWDHDLIKNKLFRSENYSLLFGYHSIESISILENIDRVHPDDRKRFQEKFINTLNNADVSIWVDEYRYLKNNGKFEYVNDKAFIIRDNQTQKATRLIGAMKIITERKLAELEKEKMTKNLLQRNKEIEQFSFITSHELRHEFAKILMIINNAKLSGNLTDELHSSFLEIEIAAKNINNVISDLNSKINTIQNEQKLLKKFLPINDAEEICLIDDDKLFNFLNERLIPLANIKQSKNGKSNIHMNKDFLSIQC